MIAGVLLAAGRSERFGADKLLSELGGRPLVCHTLSNCLASALDAIVVVVGPAGGEVEAKIRIAFSNDVRISFAHNPAAARGQMSSVKAGLRALPSGVDAAAVFLADMPLVGADITNHLLEAYRRAGGFVVPVCDGSWRHPRVIPAAHFADFLALEDAAKGATLFQRFSAGVQAIEAGEAWNFLDVDTPADIARAESLIRP